MCCSLEVKAISPGPRKPNDDMQHLNERHGFRISIRKTFEVPAEILSHCAGCMFCNVPLLPSRLVRRAARTEAPEPPHLRAAQNKQTHTLNERQTRAPVKGRKFCGGNAERTLCGNFPLCTRLWRTCDFDEEGAGAETVVRGFGFEAGRVVLLQFRRSQDTPRHQDDGLAKAGGDAQIDRSMRPKADAHLYMRGCRSSWC